MGRTKAMVYILTALLVLIAVLTVSVETKQDNSPFSVEVTVQGRSEVIDLWCRDKDCYVFLPGWADPAQVLLRLRAGADVTIAGRQITDGAACGDFPLSEPLPMTYRMWGQSHERTVVFYRSGAIPALFIDTASGSMEYIHRTKANAESAVLRLYDETGSLNGTARILAMNGRGNSTWEGEKKPYSLELTGETSLLGMGPVKKWILLADYYDTTHVRNKLAFDFARAVGCAYTPACQWTDLYLNGEYAGLYLLCQRNELGKQRIDAAPEESFLVSLTSDWQLDTSRPHFLSHRKNALRVHEGGMTLREIRDIWQSVEDAIYAPDGVDPATGKHFTELIDLTSWAQQYLLDEALGEYDAFALSQYFYYDPDSGKVFGGPLWDADNILDRCQELPVNALGCQRPHVWNEGDRPLGYALWQHESFRQRVKALYREEFRPGLTALAEGGIEDYANQCQAGVEMDKTRWRKPDPGPEAARIARYLADRIAFLDDYWANEENYVYLDVGSDGQWRRYAVRKGETAAFLSEHSQVMAQNRFQRYDTREAYDLTAPVWENTVLWMASPSEEF